VFFWAEGFEGDDLFEWIWGVKFILYFFKGFGGASEVDLRVNFVKVCVRFD